MLSNKQDVFYHTQYPFLAATPDGIWDDEILVDAKSVNSYAEKAWEDGIPDLYLIQSHFYAAIIRTNGIPLRSIDFAVLFGGQRFRIYSVQIDDELCDIIIDRVVEFYNRYIVNQEPLDLAAAPCDLLEAYYRKSNGTSITLPDDDHIGHALSEYIRIRDEIGTLEDEQKKHKAVIEVAMGEAAKGVYTDADTGKAIGVSWTETSRKSFDSKRFEKEQPELFKQYQKTSSYRVLRVTERDLVKKVQYKEAV